MGSRNTPAISGDSSKPAHTCARAALAAALHRAGRIESSAAEVEAMLVLNPSDNQGLRYRQIAAYLALARIAYVRRLFSQYPDECEFHTVFAWARVLERFLSGSPNEALLARASALKQNPFSQAYLLGHRRVPKNLPDSYASGSREEAACFAADLQLAWKPYPAAKKWLSSLSPKK